MNLITAIVLALAPLAQNADGAQAKQIDQWIGQLGSDEFAVREKATEELRKIGKPAREALEKAAQKSDDPEVRDRARALLDQMARKEDPPRRAKPGRPGFGGFSGSSVTVQTINGDSTYRITPGDGTPGLTFHKDSGGAVKLDYVDEKGESRSAEAPSIEQFVKDHADLAAKYGITDEGIDFGGARVRFKGGLPGFALPPGFKGGRFVLPPVLPAPEEGLRAEGATFEKVSEALRTQLDLPAGQGLVVSRIDPGGAAEGAGLKKSDILLEIDGRKVSSIRDIRDSLRDAKSAVVLRKGARETLTPGTPKKNF